MEVKNMDKLVLFLSETIKGTEKIQINMDMETTVVSTDQIQVQAVWDDPTGDTLLKVHYNGIIRWFNTVEEILYWVGDKLTRVKQFPLLDLI
ncbi:hypothetical protein [Romboutsia ilealis]|uniref:hypothetical protein n=1 Tax=Romboutsia ilealis TaxID=1115758 RepID=UPI0026F3AF6D|nr:hypothetical protein [Romboutsia ilealis]